MRILIIHGSLARTCALHFNRRLLGTALASPVVVVTPLSSTICHFVFLNAARE
jgi:hypothetical protein